MGDLTNDACQIYCNLNNRADAIFTSGTYHVWYFSYVVGGNLEVKFASSNSFPLSWFTPDECEQGCEFARSQLEATVDCLPGDVSEDGLLDIADVVILVKKIVEGHEPQCA